MEGEDESHKTPRGRPRRRASAHRPTTPPTTTAMATAGVQSEEENPTAPASNTQDRSLAVANSNQARKQSRPSSSKQRTGQAQIERKQALGRKPSQRTDSELAQEHPPEAEKLPRRRRAVEAARIPDVDDAHDSLIADVCRSSRSFPRRAPREADLGMGESNEVLRPDHPHQHRHKAPDRITAMASVPLGPHNVGPEGPLLGSPHRILESHSVGAEEPLLRYPHEITTLGRTAARRVRVSRGARASAGSYSLLQLMVDICMWKHVPRSALLFGFGFFCIISVSHLQEMHYSVISVLSYSALLLLAATFIKHSYLHRRTSDSLSVWVISETDALAFVRAVLPPINVMLLKLGELFSGQPVVTFKVALMLWFLAQAGNLLSFWTFVRLAYFAVFIMPKCYSTYQVHLHRQG